MCLAMEKGTKNVRGFGVFRVENTLQK